MLVVGLFFCPLLLQLLEKKRQQTVADMAESVECLSHLMRTVGRKMDTEKAKVRGRVIPEGLHCVVCVFQRCLALPY